MVREQQLPPSIFFFGQPTFYMLPNIHKIRNPGRPIMFTCSCPKERISKYHDSLFQLLVKCLSSYLKETKHALLIFDSFNLLPGRLYHLFLLDVCLLYISILHADGLKALKHFLNLTLYLSVTTHNIL